MNALIDAAFSRTRLVLLVLAALIAFGSYAYLSIAKESMPEISIPVVDVVTVLEGISPEDSERLLVEPLETQLSSLTGLKEITGSADEGYGLVTLEFEPGFDADEALEKVRVAVERVRSDLPADASDPVVNEVNTALFPILTAVLSGPIPERTLNAMADGLRDDLEALGGVLEVGIGGERRELLEVLIDPTVFETYDLSFEELIGQINRNNRLIAAGAIEAGAGRMVLKVPGMIESVEDVMNLPVLVRDGTIVTFSDIATVRRTFEDPSSFARIGGQPALSLEVKKRSGANIIETVAAVKQTIEAAAATWPDSISVTYVQDKSEQVETLLGDLETNVMAAILLVMIVIVWALGIRSAILVGLSIPGAFLAGITLLWMMGYTMNTIVLFSLILVVGLLVDGAIVTTELADRQLQEGDTPRDAYANAAKRMAWPIVASTATTLCVFLPLLFWSGVVGEFMKFLPITVIFTLTASLAMALVFIPVLGGLIGRRQPQTAAAKAAFHAAEAGEPRNLRGAAGAYVRVLQWAILNPAATVMIAVALLLASLVCYGKFGAGVSFFPQMEPEFMQVDVRTRDTFSIHERDALVRLVESRLLNAPEIASVYAKTSTDRQGDAEVIGTIQLELDPWDTRRPAVLIAETVRAEMADIAGIDVQVQTASSGPVSGKPISLQIMSRDRSAQMVAVERVRAAMERIGGFTDVTDTGPLAGVEWSLQVNRAEAARYGADLSLLGQAVQLLTQGISVADYRPADADGTVDIRVRFPAKNRTLEDLQSLRVPTDAGLVPISNFVTFAPVPRTGTINRTDQQRVISIEANVTPGLLASDQTAALRAALLVMDLPDPVHWSFAGEEEEQQAARVFLIGAFLTSTGLMFAILLLQFNSFYQAFVVMSAIVVSVAGVLIGLLVTGRPFGIVMGGIGVIALAGIVVNNNIMLVDTYNDLRRMGYPQRHAALRTGVQRLRPVLLTSLTTGLGLMPMVLGLQIDFIGRGVIQGAPSTQMWTELSTAITGGLALATVLTLVVTPALLVLGPECASLRSFVRPRQKAAMM